jgi:hypothetical protein
MRRYTILLTPDVDGHIAKVPILEGCVTEGDTAEWPIFTPLVSEYKRLQTFSVNARYTPGFRMQPGDIRGLLDNDLAVIAQLIESALSPTEQ